jgi:ATP diphosphatase
MTHLELSALRQAAEIQTQAKALGFDWPQVLEVFAKVEEELAELRAAWEKEDSREIEEEVGDLLFVVVNLARHLQVDPEVALYQSCIKFLRRFRYMKARLKEQGREMAEVPLTELEALWEEAKSHARGRS